MNILSNNPIEFNKHIQSKYFTCIASCWCLQELLDIFLIIDLQGDDRALYELIGKMIKPQEERNSLPEVIEQLTTKLHTSLRKWKFSLIL
jgi:hypothetical protein